MNYGYFRVCSAVPSVSVGDVHSNMESILQIIETAHSGGSSIVCFPELSLTGYTCGDLFSQDLLLRESEKALNHLLHQSPIDMTVIVGMPVEHRGLLFNCAVVYRGHKVIGIVPKTYIPNYNEFYEQRWFASASTIEDEFIDLPFQKSIPFGRNLLFHAAFPTETVYDGEVETEVVFGIEICEDIWSVVPPSCNLCLQGADLIFNLSASNDIIGKHNYLKSLLSQQSARCICGYIYSSCGYGESTQDLVFGGKGLIYENGSLLSETKRFDLNPDITISDIDIELLRKERRTHTTYGYSVMASKEDNNECRHIKPEYLIPKHESPLLIDYKKVKPLRQITPHPFVPCGKSLDERCEEIFNIQVMGLAKRIDHVHARSIVIGISGGLDSTLALLVCTKTMDKLGRSRKDIIGITMPGYGTTDRTYHNAMSLMQELGITIREISIVAACNQHFAEIDHDKRVHDVTYENSQARERTQILMDVANQEGGFVVGTGDLSELALGWATYNADHISNYGVNCSIPKTLVKHLVAWVANTVIDDSAKSTLLDIIDTPISPELIPADSEGKISQKTEDLVGPYELHDFFLYHFLRLGYSPSKIYMLACHVFDVASNQGNSGYGGSPKYYSSSTIKEWLKVFCRRFFTQQFKRSCLPDGPKVGSVSLSPRGDWRMPSDASYNLWVGDVEV